MKIVYLMPGYTSGMGYIGNCLPVELAKLGHEVHIVTSIGKVYFNYAIYEKSYRNYWGSPFVEAGITEENGVKIHRLPYKLILNTVYLIGLSDTLNAIKPDVIHCFDVAQPHIMQAVWFKMFSGLKPKIFILNHYLLSVLPKELSQKGINLLKIKWFLLKYLPGKFISSQSVKCYCGAIDAVEVATRYMGVSVDKCVIAELGVDTSQFRSVDSSSQEELNEVFKLRTDLGFDYNDIVCIYTGRFAKDKSPLILAEAINSLPDKYKVKGLFIGGGEQENEIKNCKNCIVVSFKQHQELAKYYRASNIGVWPKQESTSMIDAAACGIPIIISDKVQAIERCEGNGLQYIENDIESMKEKIIQLCDAALRTKLGQKGEQKMHLNFSWKSIAMRRESDYKLAITEQ